MRAPLSRDRLEEARYYLERTKETKGALPEFRYLFRALVSATRSLGWILQAELRDRYGEGFDSWWRDRATALRYAGFSFSHLTATRNELEKKGSRFPTIAMFMEYDNGPIASVEAAFDAQGQEDSFLQMIVTPRPGHPLPMRLERDQAGEDVEAWMEVHFDEILGDLLSELSRQVPSRRRRRYSLDGSEPMPFDELCTAFDSHLRDWEALLDEAEVRFS